MGFLDTIGSAIAETLKPVLLQKATELIDKVADTITVEIQKHMPAIIEAVVMAVAKTGSEIAVQGVDKVTDLIPGELDDQIVDPIVKSILGDFAKRLGL